MHKDSKKIANQLAELFANGRIDKLDWRYWIPQLLKSEVKVVRVNALNFSEGLQEALNSNGRKLDEPIELDKYDYNEVDY